MSKQILTVFGLLLFLSGICIAGEVDVKALNKANWINIESKNFYIVTDAKEKDAVEIAQELEDFYYFLALSLGYEQKNLAEKVNVLIAKNGSTFSDLGMPDGYAGVFFQGDGNNIIARCDWFESSSKTGGNWGRLVILHELVHLFLHNSSSELALPPWYDEGIAEYFSTYIKKKDKIIIGDMSIEGARFYDMFGSNGKLESIDTESLFKVSRAELSVADTSKKHKEFVTKFYTRAISIVHYLNADPDRKKQMDHYLFLLKIGMKVDKAFNYAFKMTYAELDKKVSSYFSRNKLVGTAFLLGKGGVEFPAVEFNKNSITKQDALAFLQAKLSMLSDKYLGRASVEKFNNDIEKLYPGLIDNMLQQQLAKNPENQMLLIRQAMYYQKMNKNKEAINICERLLALDGSNSFTLNNLAWLLATAPEKELRNPGKAVELAEKAVALRRSPAHLDTLAEAYYMNGSTQMAIETIKEAISLEEDNLYLKQQLEKFTATKEKSQNPEIGM
jgi:tetratricopeptide (TPR) repeat protein